VGVAHEGDAAEPREAVGAAFRAFFDDGVQAPGERAEGVRVARVTADLAANDFEIAGHLLARVEHDALHGVQVDVEPRAAARALAHASPSATSPCDTIAFESPSRRASDPRGFLAAIASPSSVTRASTAVTTRGPSLGPRPFSSMPMRKRSAVIRSHSQYQIAPFGWEMFRQTAPPATGGINATTSPSSSVASGSTNSSFFANRTLPSRPARPATSASRWRARAPTVVTAAGTSRVTSAIPAISRRAAK